MNIRKSLLLVALASSVAACGAAQPKAVAAEPQTPAAQATPPIASKADDNATRGSIAVSTDVRKACGIADIDAYFAFDSARVQANDRRVLRTLADCFVSGALKGRQMSLIGHADPRGSDDYNLALGGRRADNVKFIIVAENMNASRVSTSSRGAMDATGTNEASWAKDRSVDVMLGM
jgi:peptidoglycan-associated lipoprotein